MRLDMEFTGERFLPKLSGDIRLEHFHRYVLCSEIVKGKTVLDIASGEGYGSNILAKYAERVIGVDISSEAIEFARSKYYTPNLNFMAGDATKIPLADASVDVVVSFETIEHHDKHEEMMSEIKRVLRPSGLMILSSPNKQIYSDNAGGNHNHYHIKELYYNELHSLVGKYFKYTNYYGQKTTLTSVMLGSELLFENPTLDVVIDKDADRNILELNDTAPMYYIAIASDSPLTGILKSSIFLSLADDFFHELQKEISRLNSEIKRMSNYINEVEAILKVRDADILYYRGSTRMQRIKLLLKTLFKPKG